MEIITKFNIGNSDVLPSLMKGIAREKLSALVDAQTTEEYINQRFNRTALMADLNNIANQFLVVYAANIPAGYVLITSKGKRPATLENKRAVRISDFGVLQQYNDEAIWLSLFEKCMSVTKSYEGVWVTEYIGSPLIRFFEEKGFVRQPETGETDDFSLPAACLIKTNV